MAKAQNDQTTPEIDQELHAGADTVTEPANLLPQTFYPTETEDEELPRVVSICDTMPDSVTSRLV